MNKKYFINRKDAAFKLINDVLPIDLMKQEEWIIFAASFGGFEIAKEIAKELNTNCDIILTSKVLTPNNPQCEIAIVSETDQLVIHEELQKSFDISIDSIFEKAKELQSSELKEMSLKLRGNENYFREQDFHNKNILIVDEGLNTGLTMMSCIKTVLLQGAKSVSVAVPVLPHSIVSDVESIADDLYFVEAIPHFVSIDFYYENLESVDFEQIQSKYK